MSHPSLADEPILNILRLIRSENVGSVTFFHLMRLYGSAAAALEAAPELSRRGGRKRPITVCPRAAAETEIERTHKLGAHFIPYGHPDYPKLLLSIYDPPPLLAMLGNPALCNARPALAIVGARNASANGCHFARSLAVELGKAGYHIASGLARGIDAFAHAGSLPTGTLAVIAGGIDTRYPPENAKLYDQITKQGVIMSEQPFGMAPQGRSFPARNRIIAGMSVATIIIEAAKRSGSLITAQFALEQGREVFAVPGSPLDPRCQGANQLIRDGATLIQSAADVLSALAATRTLTHLQSAQESAPPTYTHAPAGEEELSKIRLQVIEKLSLTMVSVDELLVQCQTSPGALHVILLELELAGRLARAPGNRVCLLATEAPLELELE